MTAVVLVACGLTVGSWVVAVALLAPARSPWTPEVAEGDTADPGGS